MALGEFDRIVPKGATKVADKLSDAIAYLYTNNGKPCARVFWGRQTKPVMAYYFSTPAEREKTVTDYFGRRRSWLQAKADERKSRQEFTPGYKVGDILVSSWGYSMTIVDFYQVTEIKGKKIVIRKIAGKVVVPDGRGDGRVVADPGKFVGDPMLKLPGKYGVAIEKGRSAKKWDGSGQYFNTYD